MSTGVEADRALGRFALGRATEPNGRRLLALGEVLADRVSRDGRRLVHGVRAAHRRGRRRGGSLLHTGPVSPPERSRSTDNRAVAVAGLVWLAVLVFPVLALVDDPPAVAVITVGVLGFTVLLAAYVRAVVSITRAGPPQLRVVEVSVVAVLAVALPVALGAPWYGATVLLAVLVGLGAPWRPALAGVAATTLLAVLTAVLTDPPAPQALSIPLVTALAGGVSIVVVREVTVGRELARVTLEAERLRMARDLHDAVKQQAFVAAMELGAVQARYPDDENVGHAAASIRSVQRSLSGLIDGLRPQPGDLDTALRHYVEQWSRRTEVPVDLRISGARNVSTEPLLSVAAEAMTNIERHAAAGRVTVSVEPGQLIVGDDGHGFQVGREGHGLRGMRERLPAWSGTVEVASGPAGTMVIARYPR